MNNIVAFLPVRKGSQRIKNKNTKKFCGIIGGLTHIKISQLLKSKYIKKIIVSTNDNQVKKIVRTFKNNQILIDDRPDKLANSNTSTDSLIKYVSKIISYDYILWTHTTSPFIHSRIYDKIIKSFFENHLQFDSLMTVTKIQKFLWNYKGPINYNPKLEKWPRTQFLKPIYEINSGAFIANIDIYKKKMDRVGKNPFLYELKEHEALDIDWKIDFEISEMLWRKYGKI